ncbi:chromosomal replication initiator DnaA [Methylosinus sp. H3A]|uniref:helix-turn-helix domain-containing protein n=1 Tax=Methylosinus sp. H3A TaxID=2785786 RepID=UPI0018C234A7|nr:helix-turn-helix domain-containing protein [Methylosinus sp. H3A]MBG0809830.1 chromosomal replication initiator DnaA [Methylosinus sp. H3A]
MRRRRNAPFHSSALCVAAAAAACRVTPDELRAPSRGRARVADARHLAVYLDHVAFGASLSACGRAIARDRTSVRHACARIEDRRDDVAFDRAVAALEKALCAQKRLLEALALSFTLYPTGDDS